MLDDPTIFLIAHEKDAQDYLVPQRHRIDQIDARYGEDFADMVHSIVTLYLNPSIPESPDINYDEDFDSNAPDQWNVRSTIMCIIPNTDLSFEPIVAGLRAAEANGWVNSYCRVCGERYIWNKDNRWEDISLCPRCDEVDRQREFGLL